MEDNKERPLNMKPTSRLIENMPFLAVAGILTLVVMILAGTGFYQLRPGEAAAEQTFGAAKEEAVENEGLHWHWPWPIGATTVLQVKQSRTVEIGFNWLPEGKIDSVTGENWARDYPAATMITGDLGLLESQVVAHYYISDLNKYLFRADDPGYEFQYADGDKIKTHRVSGRGSPDGQTIRDALEIALRRSAGQRTIDRTLVSDREAIENETMINAQEILNEYQTGLSITSVQLQEIKPPDEVQDAFDDVIRAREERDTRINEALAFESQVLPEARGQAEKIRRESEAFRAQRINEATSEADRFLAILREYRTSPEIIARRIYLQTMDRVLPKTRQIIVLGKEPGPIIINTGAGSQVIPYDSPAP